MRTIGDGVLEGALGTHGSWLLEPYSDMLRRTGFNVMPVNKILDTEVVYTIIGGKVKY